MHHKLAVALAAWLLFPLGSAQAHFIWIVAKDAEGDASSTQYFVYFSEQPEPGESHLIGKVAHAKAWIRDAAGDTSESKLAPSTDEDAPALVGTCPKSSAASFEADCDYGVYERGPGMLLRYYAKHLAGDWSGAKLARAERLALDIVPGVDDGQLTLQVLYKGNPAADAEVIVWDPAGQEHSLKTDAQGRAATPAAPGRFAVRASRIETQRGGQRDGKKYAQTGHYCTLTLDVSSGPADASIEPSAAALLARARARRAVWKNFPGFSVDLTVYGDVGGVSGKMRIGSDGDVTLEMPRSPLADWVRQQLDTLVQHRMPDGEVSEGDVTYADTDRAHPLGRKVDLGDPDSQSVYRIKDDVITEVNRNAGDMWFTISVLETVRNAEQKYLPRSFTMNFFDAQSGQLKISLGYWNDWQRVGSFDLPRTILENNAKSGGTTTRQIVFSNCRLIEPKTARASGQAR